ncbi:restriction endonuclease subunit S [Streptobacillus moniliformis]|uniref:restriction endonuclease subunit S n=5 Tax=Streptobacillus moniliformis TaxID=34105 RepID=UPI0007E3DA17|nr:restriction endonuclease subunit S [Streptobacillus moniliformis]
MSASLNKKLENVQWGEYRIGDLFDSENGDFDIQKKHISNKGDYVVTAGLTDNGILGKTEVKSKIFKENTITIDMFGNAFFRNFQYKMVTHARVFSLTPRFDMNVSRGIYIVNSFKFLTLKFGYENMCSWSKIKNNIIKLPTKNGKIDFEFIEEYINELEVYHINELESYLKVTGLKDYSLTEYDKKVLDKFNELNENTRQTDRHGLILENIFMDKIYDSYENISWNTYRIEDLFTIEKTRSFNSNCLVDGFDYDYITRTSYNQGILRGTGYVNGENINQSGVWSLGLISMDFFYRKKKWYAGQFIRKVVPKIEIKSNSILFFTVILNTLQHKLKSVLVRNVDKIFENSKIQLPTKNGKIDYEFMEDFIRVIKKIVIKDVVIYADRKIEVTKKVVNR